MHKFINYDEVLLAKKKLMMKLINIEFSRTRFDLLKLLVFAFVLFKVRFPSSIWYVHYAYSN